MNSPDRVLVDIEEFSGVSLLVGHPTGVEYEHQCGGLGCFNYRLEGFLIPCRFSERLLAALDEHFVLGPKYKGNCHNGLDEEDAILIDELLAAYGHSMLTVDRNKLKQSYEAWVHLVHNQSTPGIPCCYNFIPSQEIILIWENSD